MAETGLRSLRAEGRLTAALRAFLPLTPSIYKGSKGAVITAGIQASKKSAHACNIARRSSWYLCRL